MMKRPVTILEIARESGVSPATVSRVLNNTAPVSQATRARVSAVIQKHAYTPNSFARSLSRRRTMTLGVIMPDIANPYFAGMFQEIEAAAFEARYSVLLSNTSFRSGTAPASGRRELDSFQMMLDKNVDGVLVAGGQADLTQVSPEYRAGLGRLAELVPTVVLGCPVKGVGCRFIQRERGQGVLMAVNYLASLGHKYIGFVGGESEVGVTEARLAAYADALNAFGLPYDQRLIALSDYYAADGYAAMRALLGRGLPCTAILAMNDNVALGVYRALADRGLSVPGDMSVASCDQFFGAEYFVPRLTSVDQHNERFARWVVGLLLKEINGGDEIFFTHRPELVVRESTAPPNIEQCKSF